MCVRGILYRTHEGIVSSALPAVIRLSLRDEIASRIPDEAALSYLAVVLKLRQLETLPRRQPP